MSQNYISIYGQHLLLWLLTVLVVAIPALARSAEPQVTVTPTKILTSTPTDTPIPTDTPTPTITLSPTITPVQIETDTPIPKIVINLYRTPQGELLPGQEMTINADVTSEYLSYFWSIESTNPEENSQPKQGRDSFSFTPQKTGLYTVTLMIKDEDDRETMDSILLTVSEPLAITNLVITPEGELIVGQPIAIAAQTNQIEGVGFNWKVGDNGAAFVPDPTSQNITDISGQDTSVFTFIPQKRGAYQVQVTTNYGEQITQSTTSLTVVDAFQITDFVSEREQINVGESTTVRAQTNRPSDEVMFEWAVDGIAESSGLGQDSYHFSSDTDGVYNIGLEAVYNGQVLERSVGITVVTLLDTTIRLASGDIGTQSESAPQIGQPIQFGAEANEPNVTYEWYVNGPDFDWTGQDQRIMTLTPKQWGEYQVTMMVSGNGQSITSDPFLISVPFELLPAVYIEDCDGNVPDMNCASNGVGSNWLLRWRWDVPSDIPDGWYYIVRFLPAGYDANTVFYAETVRPDQTQTEGNWLTYSFNIYNLPEDAKSCYSFWDVIVEIDAALVNCPEERVYNGVCRLTDFSDRQRSLGTQRPGACPSGGGSGGGSRGGSSGTTPGGGN